eukprot:997148-Pleurochrysis_carterae.AAC.1
MELTGACPPLKCKSKNAPGSWYQARKEALRRFSIKTYGLKSASESCQEMPTNALPEPKSYFRLRPRPDHSNYAECDECKTRRVALETLIRSSAP